MASEVRWIKIVVDIFDDEKIKLIEAMPDSDCILTLWFKLLCLAGKLNNGGILKINDRVPYTPEMLSIVFRRPVSKIKKALKIFEDFEMIELEDNAVVISNWGKHQQLDALEKKREYQRELMRKRREEQKHITKDGALENCDGEEVTNNTSNGDTNCDANSDTNVSSIDIDKEIDKDIKEKDKSFSSAEQANAGSTEVAFRILLNDKTYFDVTKALVERFEGLYPAVDVQQEIRKMIGWTESNPKNRKTKGGIMRFMNSWLSRAQDQAPRKQMGNMQKRSFSEVMSGGG